jgi:hypothetical protein
MTVRNPMTHIKHKSCFGKIGKAILWIEYSGTELWPQYVSEGKF